VIVAQVGGTLPTAGTKGSIVDFESMSSTLMPRPWMANDVIMHSIIYGKHCFQGRAPATTTNFSASTKDEEPWKKSTYVYALGTTANWMGILSTFPELRLIGYGALNVGTPSNPKWDTSKPPALNTFELEEYRTPAEWYTKIGTDCGNQAFSFMAPKSRYHPISNLPSISKTGVTIVVTQVEGDSGELIGNVVRIQSTKKVSAVKLALEDVFTDVASTKYTSPVVDKGNSSNSSNQPKPDKKKKKKQPKPNKPVLNFDGKKEKSEYNSDMLNFYGIEDDESSESEPDEFLTTSGSFFPGTKKGKGNVPVNEGNEEVTEGEAPKQDRPPETLNLEDL